MEFVFVVLGTGLFWNTVIFDLLRFTVSDQVSQNLCRRSRWCCRPSLVGDRRTRSSENSRHLTWDSSRVRLDAADCSSALDNPLIHMLKRVGLKLHPCLVPPAPWKEMCVFIANFNRTLVVYVHGFCFSDVFPQHQYPKSFIAGPRAKLSRKLFLNQHILRRLCLYFGLFVC
jgi:hypothetical protein